MGEFFKDFIKQLNAVWVVISIGITAWMAYAFSLTNLFLVAAICCTLYGCIYITEKIHSKSVIKRDIERKAREEELYQKALYVEKSDKIRRYFRTFNSEDKQPFFNIFKYGEQDQKYRNIWLVKREDFFDMRLKIFTIQQYSTYCNQYLCGIALTNIEEAKNMYIITIDGILFQQLYNDFKGQVA